MCEFKKGDAVEVRYNKNWDWQPGVFVAHDDASEYPYVVRVSGCAVGFKQCRKVRPKLELDQKVWVRSKDLGSSWDRRHFAEWGENGKMRCWINGKTSHTSYDDLLQEWEQYSLTKPE